MKKVNKNLSPDSKNNVRNIESGLKKQAFTLVELIVVITILAILGTIAFMSFQGYSRDARDSVRISDLSNIHKQLELMLVKAGTVYMPENKVDITASGTIILYQGEMGQDTLNKLKVNNGGLDPLDKTPYIYSTSKNLKQYELMGFLENGNKVSYQVPSKSPHPNPLPEGEGIASIFPQANAANYLNRFPKVMGDELGILLDSTTNEPIQSTGTGVDILNTTTNYKAYFNTTKSVTGTGGALFSEYYNRTRTLLTDKTLAKQDPSLVLYMDMETTTTSGALTVLKDLSQYGNNGSCYNSGTLVNCGSATGPQFVNGYKNKGKAMSFDGIDDRIDISDNLKFNSANDSLSLVVKLNVNDFSGGKLILDQNSYFNLGRDLLKIDFLSNKNIFNSYIGGQNNGKHIGIKNLNLDINKWYDSSVLYNNIGNTSNLSMYLNGVKYSYGIIDNPESSTGRLFIGANYYSTGIIYNYSNFFNGLIDEVRIYNRALSDTEIKTLYNSSK